MVAAAVALVVLAGVAWFLLRDVAASRQTTAAPLPPTVGVQPAIEKSVSRSFEFVGRIKAVNEVELRARVEGFLEKALFAEGQHVKVGQLLYQIEKVQYQAEVDRTKANIAIDEAELTNAQLQYDRTLDLSTRNFGTQATVDSALIIDKQHKVVQRRVKIGLNEGADVVLVSGLDVGDNVIVEGIQKVRPGQVVNETVLQRSGGG